LKTTNEIREDFLKYFEGQGHLRQASSSLIPVGDPTLLLTTAGMVQFKSYFSGETTPSNRRLTTSQKAFRVVDIDEVGDATHLTLFEMLGNFSIGDYFKEGAVEFALECFDSVMGLPKERFAATVHHTDDDAAGIWERAGIPPDRIFEFGDEDNWWGPAGDEGPCGPCSELHYDFGADRGCGLPDCGPNCEHLMESGAVCNRYVELWNLVFMQFYHHLDGTRTPLPAPSVDTGMGLERLVTVLQGVDSIYETDLFTPIIARVEEISGLKYGDDQDKSYAMRVVAEHGRSTAFLLADGVVPGNEGRGYVLRRIIRRAIRYGRQLGLEEVFLGKVSSAVIDMMGDVYPELRNHEEFIVTALRLEEEKFQRAYENGSAMLADAMKSEGTLPGEVVFKLWDTFGFPVEMTREIASEAGVEVDMDVFEKEMEAQRQRARAAGQFGGGDRAKIRQYESLGVGGTGFLGYGKLTTSSVVVGLIANGEVVTEANEGDEVEVVLVETPFYPEGGGQVGDAGDISGADGKVGVDDTQTVMPGLIMHIGKVVKGKVSLGETVDARVNPARREDAARNHTATHLLHAALRQVLGSHVRQAGSLVAADRLRFDFSHVEAMTVEEIQAVQLLVNEKIRQNATVHRSEDTYTEAIRRGALAFFGDKYEEKVRLVEIKNGATFSFEVCGGTHVERTGELGTVFVLGESSIGAGMRRIEAVSGRGAEVLVRERFAASARAAALLGTAALQIESRVQALLDEVDSLRREKAELETRLSLQAASDMLDSRQDVDGISVLARRVEVFSADALREMGDFLRDKLGSGVVALGTVIDDRPQLLVMVTPDLVESGLDAVAIARAAAKPIQGGGGGRPGVAQAGGRNAGGLDEAMALVEGLVREAGAGQ
jgi:alanyl-tRNA synthetase